MADDVAYGARQCQAEAAQVGVFGAVTGMAGNAAAEEALKMAAGIPGLVNKLLIVDTLSMKFDIIALTADPTCPVCGGK